MNPSGWTRAPISNLGQVITGSTPSTTNEENYGRDVPFVKPPDLCARPIGETATTLSAVGAADARVVPAGSVLVCCIGSLGKVGLAVQRVAFNQQINAVVPDVPELSPWLLYAFQQSEFLEKLVANSSATTIAIINKSRFSELEVPLAPLPEQQRVVEVLDSYFTRLGDATATLERVDRNLKRYRASVLKAAVEGRLVPTEAALAKQEGREYEPASVLLDRILTERRLRWSESGKEGKYQDPTPPDTADLPHLPEGWCWASVDQVGDVSGGVTKNAKRDNLSRTLPYLRVANVYANELRLDEIKEIGLTEQEIKRVLLRKHDLLVVEGNGSLDQIGRVALWDGSIDPCVHQNHLIKVRFDDDSLPEWALIWLLSPGGRLAVQKLASSTSGLHTLSISKVARLPIPLCPQAERVRIFQEVARATTLLAAAERSTQLNRRRCAKLRQSILKRAFEGRLVAQDPNDEPASVLLERIKAERESTKPAKPARSQRGATKKQVRA